MDEKPISQPTNEEIKQTQLEREKLKAENDAMDAEFLRAEKLRAQVRMAGKAVITPQEVVKEETPQEYARRVMRGGLNEDKKKGV